MSGYAAPIARLIREFGRFPGIGEKTATRLALFVLRAPEEDARRLSESILEVKRAIRLCRECYHLAETDLCEICADPTRNRETVCVVEDPDALIALEESGGFRGLYHVLHGALAPLDGIGPEQLRLRELLDRVGRLEIREVVLATNPTVQGEATALLVMKLLQGRDVRVTRIALGVPVGSDLKYADRMTLAKSLEFRRGV